MKLTAADVVLFQGDSITDAGRRRVDPMTHRPDALGAGYAAMVAARILADLPGVTVHNRGVSGDRVTDLRDRWDEDCLALRPTVVSVLVGVNDTWHGVAEGTPERGTDPETFERVYRQLLHNTRDALPGVRLVVCEPFVLECGVVPGLDFHPDIDERIARVRAVARDLADVTVRYPAAFAAALARHDEPAYWAPDGVHPSVAGHQVMADAWLDAVGLG
ncbi:MAG: SGNH/GDSL hydrolase family protein [Planctomycetota bacterium]